MIKLSIIIPCYNAGEYIHELLDILYPQLTEETELIIVDDGSKTPFETDYDCTVIRQENQGASAARNTGLDHARGEYIAFIDADDLISDKYVETILNKAKTEEFDYLYMSWKAFGGWGMNVKLNSVEDKFPPFNLCVWNRVYKKSMIGDVRFNVKKACAEDAQFIRDVKEEGRKKSFIAEYMYFYRADAKDSLTKRARAGKVDTTRIVYYYPEVTEDMNYLIEEFAELDKDVEVILMTKKNGLPELENHAMVIYPQQITGTELRGDYTPLFVKVEKPLKTQVLIYVSALYRIGGIETWTYNFCKVMSKYYDLMVLYDKTMDETQRRRLLPFAQVVKNNNKPITCDTALNCRTALTLPKNVVYKRKYMVVHTCKMRPEWEIREDAEKIFVSKAAKDTWDAEGEIIHNITLTTKPRKALLLVSASRLSWEKGENRILALAQMLHNLGILFTWLVFTDNAPKNIVDGLVYREPTLDIKSYIKEADFFVQLSDQESFCYSLVEALELGTPVISTPLPVLPEIGFEEGVNGFTVPFKVSDCDNLLEIVNSNLKGFQYVKMDSESIAEQWRKLLGDTKPTKPRKLKQGYVYAAANIAFKDANSGREYQCGEVFQMQEKRARKAHEQGFVDIIE